jgi:PTS system N-acetylglucosamine-specific IIC component
MKFIHNFFIKLGKALMLPIAVLPIAGILLRVGQPDVLNIAFIAQAGGAVFDNLPVIFAIGVAIGFAEDNHGAAALSGFVGHAIFIAGLKTLLPVANMGVLSGILIGVCAGVLYNRFKSIALPTYLAFFGGRRFVPIITGLAAIILAYIFSIIWVPVESLIKFFETWIIHSGNFGLFIYGFLNRLLIPLGLHHIINSLVWFQFGDFTVIEQGAEVMKHGDLWRFFAGDPTAGSFMALFFPVMMFGLPGAALAMILAAKPDKKKATAGILVSAALTAFLTGITEPLEFSFMFLAFPLYVIHALLTGLSGIIMNIFNIKLGFTFSAGLFDYILSFGKATHPIRLIPIGIVYSLIYFFLFSFAIKKWNIKTPGREDEGGGGGSSNQSNTKLDDADIALKYISAIGGKDNILAIDSCATRIRLEVKDNKVIDEAALKALGAKGVLKKIEGNAQIIIGPEVELLTDKIKRALGK